MAKNKNRERKQQRSSAAQRGAEQSKSEAEAAAAEDMKSEGSPAQVAHKGRKKSFGHN
ncbi:hypothetical protein [Streptomyces armeniacus]|uniref:hypothetical protein n=1 Tax=Streptomyces armeniacus TaxID=83291 RepID=UPI001AD80850|nr:hypothetical protein [Streptomyces armeniacus]